MARKHRELPLLTGVEITGIAAEGNAIAKVRLKETDPDPIVVFVPFAAPGDIANLKIDKKKHNFAEAHITDLLQPSALRVVPKCSYFGICGGCRWQHLPYDIQLEFKKQQVVDCLTRIAKVSFPEVNATLKADSIWRYRNKMEYTFSNKRWRSWEEMKGEVPFNQCNDALGFHIPGCFDKVLHIDECFLQDSIGDRIRNFIFKFAIDREYAFYDIKQNKGLLRTLLVRKLISGELMVCVTFGEDDKERIEELLTAIRIEFPEINSLLYVVNKKLNDTITDLEVISFYGKDYVEETMGELKFRINVKSFYQTNSRQAFKLYETVAKFAGVYGSQREKDSKPLVYDLYTGTGTIANFVAKGCRQVIGIEYVEEAIKDARINSAINKIENTVFYSGDMKDVLTEEFIEKHGRPDVLITDPPRAGMHENVVNAIMKAEPEVIVYVSCNPATQARDIALLNPKYEITHIQPVDMFPHTHHVENVVRLTLRN